MTIDLNTVAAVAGESAIRIREILLRAHGGFREDWLSDRFRYSPDRAEEVAREMERAGYVQRDEEREAQYKSPFPWYSITNAGRELMRASGAKRIKRETAERALSEFMRRVHLVNADTEYLYFVRSVVVFGSYIEHIERLGDIDVAVNLQSRIELDKKHDWVEIFQKHAWDSGRDFSGFEAEIDWPRQEVLLMLKARKRSISIQSWCSFVEMEKPRNFRYKVLLGDANQIRCELDKAQRERMNHAISDWTIVTDNLVHGTDLLRIADSGSAYRSEKGSEL